MTSATAHFCECGCGQQTKVNARTRGDERKGEPQRFVRGHWARGKRTTLPPPNPTGICQCGCGQPAPVAKMTNERQGTVAGEYVRFIRGHVGALRRQPRITSAHYGIEDTGYQTPCWTWIGVPSVGGYCRAKFDGVPNLLVHRVMYEQEVGPIPDGLQIDHLCGTTNCINPQHLEPVTAAENMRRAVERRRTHS